MEGVSLPDREASLLETEDFQSPIRWESLPRLALLAGPAGIGKTQGSLEYFSHLIQTSENPFLRDVLYILPSAEHRERIIDLMLRKERRGFFGERVTTFNRLMQELLKGGDHVLATDAQRRFLLSELLSNHAGEYFSAVRDLPGFLETLGDFLGELKESMVSLEAFRFAVRRLKKLCPEWSPKYEAFLKIYEGYENRLETLGIRDHRDGLFLLRETSERKGHGLPKFRHLFVDGFFDFSKSQMEFLGWLAERSGRVTLAMTVDLAEERKGLFEIPLETIRMLERIGFQVVDLRECINHRTSSETLAHIEHNLFADRRRTASVAEPDILILEATGIRGEIEMIAREIRRMVKVRGLHFSDVAVILRNIGDYEGVIRTVFREFGIPVEVHERERLRDAPLARTLASFFRILLEDWPREELLNFLKSSYVERDYAHVCSLELQALDYGIASGRECWLKEIPDPLFEKIASFQNRFQKANTTEEWVSLTREVLSTFGFRRIPVVFEEGARRDFMTLRRLEGLLREIQSKSFAQGALQNTFERFARELLGLIEVDLFSLHERDKNRVQVYDISLARQKEYKAVFLAGLLEKAFPIEIREDPVLSDKERKAVGLVERLPRQAVERYFFYLGLTRARERLILSYPRFNLEGHEALPSFYVDEVKSLFQNPLPTRSYPVNQSLPNLEDAVEERELEAYVIYRLHQKGVKAEKGERARTFALYNRLLGRDSFRNLLPRILFDPVARIEDPAVRSRFLPKGGIFKPTGLESHGRCPYRYFAEQILHLQEWEEGINAADVGKILHGVLEDYWKARVQEGRRDLEKTDVATAYVEERLQARLKQIPLRGDRPYRIEMKKIQMLEWLKTMVTKEIEEGNPLPPLVPSHFEFEFGFDPKKIDYLRLYDPHREDLKLRGKIDRIDVDLSGKYALVIDYKTGSKFERGGLEKGTALQLPLYLLAVQKLLKLKLVGAQIYQIKKAETSGFYHREGLEGIGAKKASQSVLDQKEFDKILERAVRFSFQFAEGITQADISVRPRDCDKYCPFPSVCRIEKWRLPFIYQEIREEDEKNGLV